MNMSLSKLWEMVKDRGAWSAAGHGVTKSRTQLSDSNNRGNSSTETLAPARLEPPWHSRWSPCPAVSTTQCPRPPGHGHDLRTGLPTLGSHPDSRPKSDILPKPSPAGSTPPSCSQRLPSPHHTNRTKSKLHIWGESESHSLAVTQALCWGC